MSNKNINIRWNRVPCKQSVPTDFSRQKRTQTIIASNCKCPLSIPSIKEPFHHILKSGSCSSAIVIAASSDILNQRNLWRSEIMAQESRRTNKIPPQHCGCDDRAVPNIRQIAFVPLITSLNEWRERDAEASSSRQTNATFKYQYNHFLRFQTSYPLSNTNNANQILSRLLNNRLPRAQDGSTS